MQYHDNIHTCKHGCHRASRKRDWGGTGLVGWVRWAEFVLFAHLGVFSIGHLFPSRNWEGPSQEHAALATCAKFAREPWSTVTWRAAVKRLAFGMEELGEYSRHMQALSKVVQTNTSDHLYTCGQAIRNRCFFENLKRTLRNLRKSWDRTWTLRNPGPPNTKMGPYKDTWKPGLFWTTRRHLSNCRDTHIFLLEKSHTLRNPDSFFRKRVCKCLALLFFWKQIYDLWIFMSVCVLAEGARDQRQLSRQWEHRGRGF